jgi:acetate CoA/acetoacetate CoA-transferase beta subunit
MLFLLKGAHGYSTEYTIVVGRHKIVPRCSLPLTAMRRVSLIVTEMAVIEPTDAGLVLRERGPGASISEIEDATGAYLIVEGETPEMRLH